MFTLHINRFGKFKSWDPVYTRLKLIIIKLEFNNNNYN